MVLILSSGQSRLREAAAAPKVEVPELPGMAGLAAEAEVEMVTLAQEIPVAQDLKVAMVEQAVLMPEQVVEVRVLPVHR